MTLEGGGTISQLNNATAGKSCTLKGHSQFDECKTKRQSTLRLQYIRWGWVMKSFNETTVCSQGADGPRESLNCPADCPVEGKHSLHLSCEREPWGSLGPSLLMTMGSKIVEDYATALTQTAVFLSIIFSLLDTVTSQASCASDSSTSMQTKRNPTNHQSPVDSRQYKTTTMKHQSIHQLLIKTKTKRANQQRDHFCFVCFRQSQGRSSDRDHGSDDPQMS